MTEIGVVNYQIEPTGNVIDAVWYYSGLTSNEIGSGKAKGDTSGGFPGEYIVDYFLADGEPSRHFRARDQKGGWHLRAFVEPEWWTALCGSGNRNCLWFDRQLHQGHIG